MGALADLWKSERGLITVALIVAATVLTALSVLTPERWDQWSSFVKWIFITYTAGKTITNGVALAKGVSDDSNPVAAPTPAVIVAPVVPVAVTPVAVTPTTPGA